MANGTFCLFFALILNFVIVHDVNYINKNAALLQPINISGIDEVRKDKTTETTGQKLVVNTARQRARAATKSIAKHRFVVYCKAVSNLSRGTN